MKMSTKTFCPAVVASVEEDSIAVKLEPLPDTPPGVEQYLTFFFPPGEPHRYSVGDNLTVVMTLSLGRKAFTPVYFLPLVVLVGSLLLLVTAGVEKGVAGVSSLGILALYYFILYIFRRKLKKATHYDVEGVVAAQQT
jgi:sigma-E factor negative regulatory protein RseC